jgi:hypothetical protein
MMSPFVGSLDYITFNGVIPSTKPKKNHFVGGKVLTTYSNTKFKMFYSKHTCIKVIFLEFKF